LFNKYAETIYFQLIESKKLVLFMALKSLYLLILLNLNLKADDSTNQQSTTSSFTSTPISTSTPIYTAIATTTTSSLATTTTTDFLVYSAAASGFLQTISLIGSLISSVVLAVSIA
jgi:hypothetical protein